MAHSPSQSRADRSPSNYEKHQFFTKQLIEAGVPRDIAVQDACRLEHVISETSFNKLKEAAWMKAQEVIPSEK